MLSCSTERQKQFNSAIQLSPTGGAAQPTDATGEIPDVCIIELGGTVGDIENMPFVEALRQLMIRIGEENFCTVYVSRPGPPGAFTRPQCFP